VVAPERNVYCVVRTYWFEVVDVDEPDGDVLVVLPERHRPLAAEPTGKLLVALDRAVGADGLLDRPELVEHLVGEVGVGGDLGVEPAEGIDYVLLDPRLVMLPGEIGRGDVVPADARDSAGLAGEARTAGRDHVRPGEGAGDESFDGVGFVESHRLSPPAAAACMSECMPPENLRFRCWAAVFASRIAVYRRTNVSSQSVAGIGNGSSANFFNPRCAIEVVLEPSPAKTPE
jgi:hypothetical protein